MSNRRAAGYERHMNVKTRFRALKARLQGRQVWRYYHFDEDHVASPFKRVPLRQAMMVDAHRLVYLPIAKNACSSLKTLVANLGGMELGPEQDIHGVLDHDPNRLVFLNRDDADIRAALSAPDWMRFCVLRHPLDRLVSVYVEKFVKNRHAPGMRITCDPVLLRSLNKWHLTEADYDRGITFRSFAQDLLSEPPQRLDPHWRPQSLFLNHIPHTHLYTVDMLGVLKSDLEGHIGAPVDLPHKNRVRMDKTGGLPGICVADALPGDLDAPEKIDMDRFMDAPLRAQLSEYFAQDLTLFDLVHQMNANAGTGRISQV